MRISTMGLIGALLLVTPGLAAGQSGQQGQSGAATSSTPSTQVVPPVTPPSTAPKLGQVDFGFRGDSVKGDEARFNRYRDLSQGGVLDRFRYGKITDAWVFFSAANNVGYEDQSFLGEFEATGQLKTRFIWSQIPLFISERTASLQTDRGDGVLGVDDSIQQRIQAGTLTLSNAMTTAVPFEMKSRRDVAMFDTTYTAGRDVDFKFELWNSRRSGTHIQNFGLLNSPGNGITQEMGIPMDTRTTDVKAVMEYANSKGMLSVGMNGSWFDNRLPTVQFDNPLRSTDISGGPSKGLAVTSPSNSLVSFVVDGGYKLPAKTRATAAISIGRANQNEPLVAPTINSALVAPPLERSSAEARGEIVSMVYGLNSRPAAGVWLNARYRYYDYTNKTPIFDTVAIVGDWAVGTAQWETEPLSQTRHTVDLDATFTPLAYVAFGIGYSRDRAERTFRIFEETDEDMFRVTLDSVGNQYVTLRLKYEASQRTGSGFDEHLLEEVGEQPDMRHFDIADRDRSRVTGILTVTPVAWLNLNGSIGTGHDDYESSGFGLRDNRSRTFSVGFELMPANTVSVSGDYSRDKYTANQYSRTSAPATFADPRGDWWIDSNDTVSTVTASVDLLKTLPKTDIRVSYDLSDGKATYVYGLPSNSTAFTPPASLRQLAPLINRLTGARVDLQYYLRSNIAAGVAYWYEDYNVNDFSLNPITINTLNVGTSTIYSGYLYQPYTAHTYWLRLTYLW